MEHTKFRLAADCIEISGTQEFVEAQLEKFKSLIESSYEKILERPPHSNWIEQNVNRGPLLLQNHVKPHQLEEVEFVDLRQVDLVDHESVYVMDGANFQLVSDVPGSSVRNKMINVVLIYLYAKLKAGVDTVGFNELRDVCLHAGEFDASNFSKIMENNKRYFLLTGGRKSKTAKLIRPGIKEAERLILELNQKTK